MEGTVDVIDDIVDSLNTLKREVVVENPKYWIPDFDLLFPLLNGVKTLISEGLMKDTVYCQRAKDELDTLRRSMKFYITQWSIYIRQRREERIEKEWEIINMFGNEARQFERNMQLNMRNCRLEMYETMKIGCNDFLNVYANVDVLKDQIPDSITLEGKRVQVRILRRDGFEALYNKMTPRLSESGIGIFATRQMQSAAFLLVICEESPFHLKAFKVIHQTPLRGYVWDVSGGLESFVPGKGLGSRLMKATEALGHAYGIDVIKIEVVESARPFYEKFGMQDTEKEAYMSKQIGISNGRRYTPLVGGDGTKMVDLIRVVSSGQRHVFVGNQYIQNPQYREYEGVNTIPIDPNTGVEFRADDISARPEPNYSWAYMRVSDEDERLIKSMPQRVIVNMWKEIARETPQYVFNWNYPIVNILDDDTYEEEGDGPLSSIDIRRVGGRFDGFDPRFNPDLTLQFRAEFGFKKYSGNLWYMSGESEKQRPEAVNLIMPLLQQKVQALLVQYKKAKEAVRMTRALSLTASFRQPLDTGVFTRSRRQRMDATESNDAAINALTVFQDKYLKPQLRDAGAQFPMGMATGPRAMMERARAVPFIESVFLRAGIRGGMPKRGFGAMEEDDFDYDQVRRLIVIQQLDAAKAKYAENLTILCGAVRMGQVSVPSSFYVLLKSQNDEILALQGQLARPERS